MQTPRTVRAAINGYLSRVKNDRRESMYAAWHIAAFQRGKLPALAKVLGDEKAVEFSPNDQLMKMVRAAQKRGVAITVEDVD